MTHPADNLSSVLVEIAEERQRQDATWGEQNHPDGTGPRVAFAGHLGCMAEAAEQFRLATHAAAGQLPGLDHGPLTWRHILLEEVFEAFAEDHPDQLRAELIQAAAVAAAWIEALDRRAKRGKA